jgi:hypothetical protein
MHLRCSKCISYGSNKMTCMWNFAWNECCILVEVIVCHNGVKMGSDLLTSHKYCRSKDHTKEKDCSWWVGGWSTTTIDHTLIVIDCWSQHVTFKYSLNLSCSIKPCKKKKKNPSLWLVLSLNNPENHKLIFKKCPCESDENGEYFTSLMTKFVNTTHRHLYKQPPFASNYTWHLLFFILQVKLIAWVGDYFLGPLDAWTLWLVFALSIWWITWTTYVCF